MENNLDKEQLESNKFSDYYNNRGKKITDIFIGLGGGVLYFLILWWIGASYYPSMTEVFTIGFIIYFVGLFLPFIKGRRFIGIGLVILIFVPLIMIGGCLTFIGFH